MSLPQPVPSTAPVIRWQIPVSLLPRPLLDPQRPLLALVVGWLTAFLPSIALSALVVAFTPRAAQPQLEINGLYAFMLVVIFAPVTETLIMGGLLYLLLRFVSPTVAVLASSIGWGLAHSLAAPAWGLVIWWPFLVFSTLFVTWSRRSLLAGAAMAAGAHALQNLGPGLLLLYGVRA